MKFLLSSFAVVSLCLIGCGKSKPETTDTTQSPAPASQPAAEQPSAPPPTADAAPATGDAPAPEAEDPSLEALNKSLTAYIMGQLKEPTTLEELVKAGYIKRLPQPPPGKKFALNGNRTAVVLVNK